MLQKQEGQLDFLNQQKCWRGECEPSTRGLELFYTGRVVFLKFTRHTVQTALFHRLPGRLLIIFLPLFTVRGWLVLDEVQPAGKKPMAGDVFCGVLSSGKGQLHGRQYPKGKSNMTSTTNPQTCAS
jgi:hypothetical protein